MATLEWLKIAHRQWRTNSISDGACGWYEVLWTPSGYLWRYHNGKTVHQATCANPKECKAACEEHREKNGVSPE